MADSTVVFLILAGVVVLFVSNRVPVEVVAIGTALSLWATDVLDLNQALAGFGDPTVLFIAALFVVSEALDATGVTAWAGQQLVARAGDSRRRLLVLMMLMCAALTAFISVNGAVAALVPVVVVTAVKLRTPSSQLMMPLAFAAHAGSMLTLTGSPVNVLVSEAAEDAGADAFGYFEFTLVGIPLLVGTIVIVVLFGNRLLPHRNARYMPADFSEQARVLLENYDLDHDAGGQLFTRKSGVAEVIVRPRSGLIGETAFPGMVTESGDLVVLAVHRKGEDLGPKEVTLAAGDVMLLKGTWDALAVNLEDPDVLVVDEPRVVRRQAVPLGPGAKRTLVIVGLMVVLLATGAVPAAVAGLLAAGALILTRVMTHGVCVPGDQLDDDRARRRDDPAVRGDAGQRRRRQGRRRPARRRRRAVHAVDRPVRRDRRSRTADQQHGHRTDRHPGGDRRGRRTRRLRAAGADVRHRDLVGGLAHSRRHPGQPDGDGPRGISLR